MTTPSVSPRLHGHGGQFWPSIFQTPCGAAAGRNRSALFGIVNTFSRCAPITVTFAVIAGLQLQIAGFATSITAV